MQLSYAHNLVPGPKWLDKCLVNSCNIKHYKKTFSDISIEYPTNDLFYKVKHSNDFFWSKYTTRNRLSTYIPTIKFEVDKLSARIRKLSKYLIQSYSEQQRRFSGFSILNADEFYLQYGCGTSVWDTGYSLWRYSVDTAFEDIVFLHTNFHSPILL